MRRVFVDSALYIALLNEDDDLHDKAVRLADDLNRDSAIRLVTTDAVLLEIFAYASGRGAARRAATVAFAQRLRESSSVDIIEQGRDLLDRGIDLYAARPDKRYSLVECMSMAVCRYQRTTDVLTHDRDFQQEGLTILL